MLESQFLEAYIHLEKLCNEMYDTNHGVSKYIEFMEAEDYSMRNRISSWTAVYKKLKNLRWKRNQYVHEGKVLFDKYDVDWLIEFYNLIMTGNDPLALKNRKSRKIIISQRNYNQGDYVERVSTARRKKSNKKGQLYRELWYGMVLLMSIVAMALLGIAVYTGIIYLYE